ncbi:PEP-CTERM sorting domain-containing protein [Meridianimarinicoccus sp. MJW13]|uniref:PEP-CTERM sorting domain-containing protein n=1 Tax=Meridianimarinicoccus sp. MJW13 TaxID=2720031 RepID=UPI001865B92F|nr:PA14 domain-containing protein [Fluviibacterium sp. MJW13]
MKITGIVVATTLVLSSGASHAASYLGEFWDSTRGFRSVDDAIGFANSTTTTGQFVSTMIDYPNGWIGSISDRRSISDFLGVDAASYTGTKPTSLQTSVVRISGRFQPGSGTKTFSVGSDDGFALSINGTEISRRSSPRGFGYTNVSYDVGSNPVDFVLTYYENYGYTGLHFKIDGKTVTDSIAVAPSNTPAPVPLPAALPMLALGLGALGVAGRRLRKPRA